MNLVTSAIHEPMFNPETLEEVIAVNYTAGQVPGYSQAVEQFLNTDSCKFSFELFYTCVGEGPAGLKRVNDAYLFLKSLTHPHRSESVKRGGPPRFLFVWPNLITLTCLLKQITFTHTQFNSQGSSIAWKAKIQITEVRDVFVGMDDILQGASTADFSGL